MNSIPAQKPALNSFSHILEIRKIRLNRMLANIMKLAMIFNMLIINMGSIR